jgi:hypothetical protein
LEVRAIRGTTTLRKIQHTAGASVDRQIEADHRTYEQAASKIELAGFANFTDRALDEWMTI